MFDQVAHVLASALVFALFVPGVLVTLGGRYAVLVHAVLFALVHSFVRRGVDSLTKAVGVPTRKKMLGEDGAGQRKY
jgi:hypothetical protein